MQEETALRDVLRDVLREAPVLLICLACLVITLCSRKATTASRWAAAAFTLALVICGCNILGFWQVTPTLIWLGVPVLRAATYLLLFFAVYSDRKAQFPANGTETFWQPVIAAVRARPGLKGLFVTTSVLVFLLVFLGSILYGFLLPETFAGTARIKLEVRASNGVAEHSALAPGKIDPRFLLTECQVIQSEMILKTVIERLDLNREFGKRYTLDFPLKTSETLLLLRKAFQVLPVANTSLIEIRAFSESPKEAAQFANEIALAYQRHYAESDSKGSPNVSVEIIDRAVADTCTSSSNRGIIVACALWGGLWLGVAAGGGLVLFTLRYGKEPAASPARYAEETAACPLSSADSKC